MSLDLAIGPTNDFLFGANRDLLGVSGTALYDQRIKTRLKIRRGSWVFDTDGTLGSRLDFALGQSYEKAAARITSFVHEALDDMTDIQVVNVDVKADPNDTRESTIILIVGYVVSAAPNIAPVGTLDEQIQQSTIFFQL